MSEDCLYLNVWTPAKSATRPHTCSRMDLRGRLHRPGPRRNRNYSGESLAKKGVVFVSIAYRVGQLGFLAHPELSAENKHHVSGNYGLLDMIAGPPMGAEKHRGIRWRPEEGDYFRRIRRRALP